jgi:hypothetical protein
MRIRRLVCVRIACTAAALTAQLASYAFGQTNPSNAGSTSGTAQPGGSVDQQTDPFSQPSSRPPMTPMRLCVPQPVTALGMSAAPTTSLPVSSATSTVGTSSVGTPPPTPTSSIGSSLPPGWPTAASGASAALTSGTSLVSPAAGTSLVATPSTLTGTGGLNTSVGPMGIANLPPCPPSLGGPRR